MSWQERILDDGTDRESWLRARDPLLGASDAAKFARMESVDKYVAAKLAGSRSFHGNDFTASGNRWEPMMLAWAGITPNRALIHAPGERGFAATPDGAEETRGAECKAKHGVIVEGPSVGEWRQLAWQFVCVPEFESIEFIWVELIDGEIRNGADGEPRQLTVKRDDPRIVKALDQVLPIAREVLARLTAALQFEKEMNAL